MKLTVHRDVQLLPFNMYSNRPLDIASNSKYGSLKYKNQGLYTIVIYNLSLQIDELHLYDSRHYNQLNSPVIKNYQALFLSLTREP